MTPLATLAAILAMGQQPIPTPSESPLYLKPPDSRFERMAPLPTIPSVMLDKLGDSWGIAQQVTHDEKKPYQARILWIDGTANLDRVNDADKIHTLLQQIKLVGFNTIVFDIKPISGQVLYSSKIAPKLTEWRGKTLPPDFDPLAVMCREAKSSGLSLFVSMNAFSEGHRDFKVGPGYAKPDQQTVLYEPKFFVTSLLGGGYPVSATPGKMPVDDTQLATYSDKKGMPPSQDVYYAVTLNRNGIVVESLTGAAMGNAVIPTNGCMLIGTGNGANYLRAQATPGTKLTFDSTSEFVPISTRPDEQIPLMMNPNDPRVRDYILSIVNEVTKNYDIDGLIFDDRLRFAGMNADFSPLTQSAFERFVGRRLSWPEDVYKITLNPSLNRGIAVGHYYDAWMAWRAMNIRNFVLDTKETIHKARPKVQFGIYTGSWYGEYPKFGTNWASPDAEAGFFFLTPDYQQTGIAHLLDFVIAGCYYPTATIAEALSQGVAVGFSVEAAGQLVNRMVRDQAWSYAGISLDMYANNPDGLRNALQASVASTQGVMVFDLSHNIDPMLPVFRQAFDLPVKAPHAEPGLLAEVRKRRAAEDKKGRKDPPVPISSGGAGVGM